MQLINDFDIIHKTKVNELANSILYTVKLAQDKGQKLFIYHVELKHRTLSHDIANKVKQLGFKGNIKVTDTTINFSW